MSPKQLAPAHWIEGPEHRLFLRLAGRFDAQLGTAPGPAACQIGRRERLRLVEEHQIDRARSASPRCSDFDKPRNAACSAASAVSVDFPGMHGLYRPHPRLTAHTSPNLRQCP